MIAASNVLKYERKTCNSETFSRAPSFRWRVKGEKVEVCRRAIFARRQVSNTTNLVKFCATRKNRSVRKISAEFRRELVRPFIRQSEEKVLKLKRYGESALSIRPLCWDKFFRVRVRVRVNINFSRIEKVWSMYRTCQSCRLSVALCQLACVWRMDSSEELWRSNDYTGFSYITGLAGLLAEGEVATFESTINNSTRRANGNETV